MVPILLWPSKYYLLVCGTAKPPKIEINIYFLAVTQFNKYPISPIFILLINEIFLSKISNNKLSI